MTIPVITRDKCIHPKTNWGASQITEGMICAGDKDGGESHCNGDSGGPLILPKSATDDTAVVIAASSFGKFITAKNVHFLSLVKVNSENLAM